MDAPAFVVERWRTTTATRYEKIVTALTIAFLIFVGGSVFFSAVVAWATLALDASCKAPATATGGACAMQTMTIERVYTARYRGGTSVNIVLRARDGSQFDREMYGDQAEDVYEGAKRHTDRRATIETLRGEPFTIDTSSGHATFSAHPDPGVAALGLLMLCGGIACIFVGPGRTGRRTAT